MGRAAATGATSAGRSGESSMFPGGRRDPLPFGSQKGGEPRGTMPSLTSMANSQQFQWMLQPNMGISDPQGALYHRPYPYPEPGLTPGPSGGHRGGVIRVNRPPQVGRRRKEEQLSPEEEERKMLRRERNKVAAAKCRNRRRELTDYLQAETDQLEEKKSLLTKEVSELQKEKERLEFVLEAHQPICKIVAGGRSDEPAPGRRTKAKRPSASRSRPPDIAVPPLPEAETLHTPPTLVKTPSAPLFPAALAFTYPYDPEPSGGGPSAPSRPEACSAAHRRSSSSGGDQSSDSLSSPTLVVL